jgi:hypothetical protein
LRNGCVAVVFSSERQRALSVDCCHSAMSPVWPESVSVLMGVMLVGPVNVPPAAGAEFRTTLPVNASFAGLTSPGRTRWRRSCRCRAPDRSAWVRLNVCVNELFDGRVPTRMVSTTGVPLLIVYDTVKMAGPVIVGP